MSIINKKRINIKFLLVLNFEPMKVLMVMIIWNMILILINLDLWVGLCIIDKRRDFTFNKTNIIGRSKLTLKREEMNREKLNEEKTRNKKICQGRLRLLLVSKIILLSKVQQMETENILNPDPTLIRLVRVLTITILQVQITTMRIGTLLVIRKEVQVHLRNKRKALIVREVLLNETENENEIKLLTSVIDLTDFFQMMILLRLRIMIIRKRRTRIKIEKVRMWKI